MTSVADIFALAAKVPLSFLPGVTWAVVTWTALGVYQITGFKMFISDYVIAPILITYLIYLSWKRSSWAGVAGSVLGIVLAVSGAFWFGSIIGNAVGLLASWFWNIFAGILPGLLQFFLMAFAAGLVIGFASIGAFFNRWLYIFIAIAISAAQGFVIYSWLTYFQGLILTSAYRAVNRMTYSLQGGVHVLAGIGVASTVGALDVIVTIAVAGSIVAYSIGLWLGALAAAELYSKMPGWGLAGRIDRAIEAFLLIIVDIVVKGIALAASKLEHAGVVSFAISSFLFHMFGVASVGLAWLAAVSLIFSRRRGHMSYPAMAGVMLAVAVIGFALA